MGVGAFRLLLMPKQRHLKNAGIRPRTLRLYRFEVSQFFTYLATHGFKLPSTFAGLDDRLAEYINHLYQEGESISRAGWVLSGFRRFYPRVRRELAVSQQWYINWTRTHTPERATPITWRILRAGVALCEKEGWHHLAATMLIGFIFMLRTQEMLLLTVDDVLFAHGTVTIRLVATKTSRQYEQSLSFEDPVVVSILETLVSKFRRNAFWPFSMTYFRTCFRSLHSFFGLDALSLVPYSIRRGAATHFYQHYNNLDFVMVQGRWKDLRTARIYLDDSRATLVKFQAYYTSSPQMTVYLHHWRKLASGTPRDSER